MTTSSTRTADLEGRLVETATPASPPPMPPPKPPELVYAHAQDVPARNPHRFAVCASALILLVTAFGPLASVHGDDEAKGGAAFALLTAVGLFVFCLIRFHARAQVGDR